MFVESRIPVLFALILVAVDLVSCNVEINCQDKSTNPTERTPRLHDMSLTSSCFVMDIRLNVENPLPDPSYIVPETNIDIIQNALQNILMANNIHGLSIETIPETWYINNQCPVEDHTVHKSFLQTVPYTIECDEKTLKVDTEFIECEFSTPSSIAYIWKVESISTMFTITGQDIIMNALITDSEEFTVAESDTMTITAANNAAKRQFVFADALYILQRDTRYVLRVQVIEGFNVEISKLPSAVSLPVVSTIAEPNACKLATLLAMDHDMLFAVYALCNADNAEPQRRQALEDVLYQSRSSQKVIPSLPPARRRLLPSIKQQFEARDPPTFTEPPTDVLHTKMGQSSGSLHVVDSAAKDTLIADNSVFPNYRQCIAVDPDTNRVYSVGGDIYGYAINRLTVHQIINENNAQLIGSLLLDGPRSGAMCYYFKNPIDNIEYIVVMNGMDEANDVDINNWFNDIVFIPIDNNNIVHILPKITLKHNVIDMKAIITETNELYLFGGRDADNAKNYIQSIDLNHVFNADSNDGLSTVVRMEPMLSNVVIPFVDFVAIEDKTCMMIFGGQSFVNREWIDIQIPTTDLQLICNDNILTQSAAVHTWSAFDEEHVQSVASFNDYKDLNHVFMTDYNFTNNGIWYSFNAAFEICGDNVNNDEYLAQILNVFDTDSLSANVLSESQRVFTAWNDGFSKVSISGINFIRTASVDALNHCIGLSQSVCDGLVISGNGGDQECGYNELNGECYSIQRSHQSQNNNRGNLDTDLRQPTIFDVVTSFEKLYVSISVLGGFIFVLVFIITAMCCIHYRKEKAMRLRLHKVASFQSDIYDVCDETDDFDA